MITYVDGVNLDIALTCQLIHTCRNNRGIYLVHNACQQYNHNIIVNDAYHGHDKYPLLKDQCHIKGAE